MAALVLNGLTYMYFNKLVVKKSVPMVSAVFLATVVVRSRFLMILSNNMPPEMTTTVMNTCGSDDHRPY